MKKHVLASMVAAATMGFLTPLTSHAFGLGKLNVMSALNEPFKAEIDVNALRPEEKDNLQVKMASDEEFAKAGLDRNFLLNQMQFDIVERSGQHKILITSKNAIKEPFLDFLIMATAGSGLMLREYTVLLDPPEFVLAETRPATSSPAPQTTTSVETASSAPTTTSYKYAQSTGFSGDSYKVKRNDTLWNVALETRPSSDISVHQMMMALQKRNPSAFTNDNVNGLKAGVTLQIPSRSEIEALSASAARQAFAEQNEAWKNRNSAAVTTVTQTEPVSQSEAESTDTVDGAEQAVMADTAETQVAAADDTESRLQLVAPEDEGLSEDDAAPSAGGNDQLKQLSDQLTLAQETIETQTQENIDLQERNALLEEQIETMRRMLSLEDTDLARMQDMLEEEPAIEDAQAETEMNEQAAIGDEMVSDVAEQEPTDEMAETDTTVTAEEVTGTEQTSTDEPLEEAAEQTDDVIATAASTLGLDEAQVRSTVDNVKQFVTDNKLPTAIGLLLVLLVLWLISRRKREVTWDEAVKTIDKSEQKDSGQTTVVSPEPKDDLTDAPVVIAEPEEHKSAAELVEQADMFVGYADYVQAKSSLAQAKALEPNNALVDYKTLFVLYKLNQADEFIEVAEQADFEPDSFEWSEIQQWGQQLSPGNSLFTAQASSSEEADEDIAEVDLDTTEADAALDLDADAALDVTDDATVATDDAGPIEFDLNSFADPDAETPVTEEEAVAEKPEAADDDLLSFDTNFSSTESDDGALNIDLDDDATEDNRLAFEDDAATIDADDSYDLDTPDAESAQDSSDLSLDIGDLDDIDEAETKLDLAAAYIDMGDPDGARSILNEVLVEGSEDQKNRADELLKSLA